MEAIWGIHNDHPDLDLIGNSFVSVGWDALGDLRLIGSDKETMKSQVATDYPEAKPGAIPIWTGILLRFAFELQAGDIVIYPFKPDSTLNFGKIESDYYYEADASIHRHRRNVKWLKTGVPRAHFSKSARYEVGSAVTLFRVKNHASEFLEFIEGGSPPDAATDSKLGLEAPADEA